MVNKRQILYTLESWCKEKTELCMSFIYVLGALNYPAVFWLDYASSLERQQQIVQEHRSTQIKFLLLCYQQMFVKTHHQITVEHVPKNFLTPQVEKPEPPILGTHSSNSHHFLLLSLSDSHYPSHGYTGRTDNPWPLCLEELHVKVLAPNTHAADN